MHKGVVPTAAPAAAGGCYHCGEPLAGSSRHLARIAGEERTLCCAGCEAVARAIVAAGLEGYYLHRSAAGRRGQPAAEDVLQALDSPAYQASVVQVLPGDVRAVSLLLEGVTCAACVWLIERRLQALPGMLAASVNFSTRRTHLRWDGRRLALSGIVRAIRAVGYDAQPYDPDRGDSMRRREARSSLWRLAVAGLGMMQVMMYAVPAYVGAGEMTADIEQLLRWASLFLTAPVIAFSCQPFFRGACRDLAARTVGMDTPVALAIAVAFVASVYATFSGSGPVYFDSIAMFVFLLLAARHLEAMLRARAGEAMERLGRMLPAFALRLEGEGRGEAVRRIAVAELAPGDRVVVAAGDVVPADGVVETGESEVDESLLTGEARGVRKLPGATLVGGSVNVASRLVMRIARVGADTTVAGIVRLLDRAAAEKPRIAQLADRFAARFLLSILAVAALAGLAWSLIDPARALPVAVTVLVITCPCALSLATPAALAAATGSLSRLGVLITRGHALETLARATHVVFDKTGTLTTGEPALVGVMPLGALDAHASLALAAALEQGSRHPLAHALVQAAQARGMAPASTVSDMRDVPGEGVEARSQGRRVRIGRVEFVAGLCARPLPDELAFVADGVQVIALADEQRWLALFTLSDTLRPEAPALIAALRAAGVTPCLLSGDRANVTHAVARSAGIETVEAEARPQDKVRFVRALQQGGAVVAMIGDGVNDAPVLAQAQVAIALGSGADLAQSSADVVLAQGGIARVADLLAVARKAERIVRQNLLWAGAYNLIAVPAAVLGVVDPLLAAVGMAASSLVVVLNAMRAAHPVLWRRSRLVEAVRQPVTGPALRPA